MSRLVCREKNMVITRQILQFQDYITFMGQWGKSTAQFLKRPSLSAGSNLRLSIICPAKVSKRWKRTKYGMRLQWLEDDCCGVAFVQHDIVTCRNAGVFRQPDVACQDLPK